MSPPSRDRSQRSACSPPRLLIAIGLAIVGCQGEDPAAPDSATVPAFAASSPSSDDLPATPAMPEDGGSFGEISSFNRPDSIEEPSAIRPPDPLAQQDAGQTDAGRTTVSGLQRRPSRPSAAHDSSSDTGPGLTGGASQGLPLRIASDPPAKPTLLRSDLTPEQLVDVLGTADHDIHLIMTGRSGIDSPEQAKDELVKIIQMKKEAATRLAENPSLSDKLRDEGLLGKLQALSHLAALGDVGSADELEKLARQNLSSPNQDLVDDSRLVLIGFAMEDLQNGVKGAAEKLLDLVVQLNQAVNNQNVPALMTMGNARELFSQYGEREAADTLRRLILERFADSPDPQVANLAAQLAGSVPGDEIEQLLIAARQDPSAVTTDQWRTAVNTLIDQSADLQTVKFLAGAALEYETLGQAELADVTYQVLQTRWSDSDSAASREAHVAVTARQARQAAIGSQPSFSLPTVEGKPISMQDFRGKVVVMPFWTMEYAPSTSVFKQLQDLRGEFPDQVAIVGLNFHSDPETAAKFVASAKLDFPNFRDDGDQDSTANPSGDASTWARKFGVVSLPCVVIFDQQGHLSAIEFVPDGIEASVKKLL